MSLGHAGLFGIGSYVTGVLVFKLGVSFWLAIPASILGAAVFGAILALPALRVTAPTSGHGDLASAPSCKS